MATQARERTKVGPALRARLQSAEPHDTFEVNVFLPGEPAAARVGAALADDGAESDAVQGIKRDVREEQAALLDYLHGQETEAGFTDDGATVPMARSTESFWINNAVTSEVTRELLMDLLDRPDVLHVELNRHAPMAELIDAGRPRRGRRPALAAAPQAAALVDAPEPAWSVKRVNAPLLWQLGITGDGIVVAVVDTGVNYRHPDLARRMWVPAEAAARERFPNHGYDFWRDDNDPFDEQGADGAGHGTACAGLVAGDGSSGTGTGVAPGARIMAIRVGGSENQFWRGLQFAIDNEAQVISMSMTWKYPSGPNYPGWRRTCETILAAGILHANSVGNQGADLTRYPLPFNIAAPGNCPSPWRHPRQVQAGQASPISCGATDDADRLAPSSGRGPAAWEEGPYTDYPYQGGARPGLLKPDVCAPGPGTISCNFLFGEVRSAKAYRDFGGTSAATPHVAGCLALLAHACQRAGRPVSIVQVQEALETTAHRIEGQAEAKENHFGAGRVDVYAAFKLGQERGWW